MFCSFSKDFSKEFHKSAPLSQKHTTDRHLGIPIHPDANTSLKTPIFRCCPFEHHVNQSFSLFPDSSLVPFRSSAAAARALVISTPAAISVLMWEGWGAVAARFLPLKGSL